MDNEIKRHWDPAKKKNHEKRQSKDGLSHGEEGVVAFLISMRFMVVS